MPACASHPRLTWSALPSSSSSGSTPCDPSVAILARYEIEGFASLWCMWAAITAGGIALYMRMSP